MKIEKCPFCGGEARIKSRYIGYGSVGLGARDWYTVECNECRAKSDEYGAELEAIAAWNRRTDHIRDTTEKVSNADRIRAMSDEELARWLVDATVWSAFVTKMSIATATSASSE